MTATAVVRMRNVTTGEVRDVELDSDEYVGLKAEVYDHQGSQRPKWEVQGDHNTRRVDSGEIQEADHGYDDKPVAPPALDPEALAELKPDPEPHLALTDGEIESGLTPEDKAKQLADSGIGPTREAVRRRQRAESRVGHEGASKRGKRGGRSRSADSPHQGDSIDDLKGDDLDAAVRDAGIEGHSTMSADEKRDALRSAGGGS